MQKAEKQAVQANTKKKMTPLRSEASAAYQHYERKKQLRVEQKHVVFHVSVHAPLAQFSLQLFVM